ncbi:hypothetical protein PIB30_072161 [Stylosanthes scabra]|uniref:Uncharacterized protein n=1 Tax=Stylosanthes scabra TaxID=79078 RepID=A0ABU6UPM3_9FABA|nr:hypothetical protein [Stylosanthes scabra]
MILRTAFSFSLTNSPYYNSATIPRHHLLRLLQLCVDHYSLKLTHQSHAQILTNGFSQDPFLLTRLISAYATCGYSNFSRRVFDTLDSKNVYLWNSMINAYAKHRDLLGALKLFRQMGPSVSPDDYTLATVSKVCGELEDLICGKSVHGKSVRTGFLSDVVVANSVMAMYSRCGVFTDAMDVFDEMSHRTVSSFNVIIFGFASLESCGSHSSDGFLLKFFMRMQSEGFEPDAFTVASLLPMYCGGSEKWDHGKEIHCYLVKNGLDLNMGSDVHVGSSLIDMYSRSGRVDLGRAVFDQMKSRNVYVWTAMINGYVKNRAPEHALVMFREMQAEDGIRPNKVSLISVLLACSLLAGLIGGKQVHTFAIKLELNDDVSLCNALIDMYSKCGSLDYSRRVFDNVLYYKDGIKPDMITVVGVLSACSKSGLVDEGIGIYNSLMTKHEMQPAIEICACVVDMLGRSGRLDQALKFIKKMPLDPSPSVWGSLLSASIIHGNSATRNLAYRCLLELEPENPSNYISLSNTYASDKRWDVVTEVRTIMKERGLRKVPGCSWITISGKTHSFMVADKAHPSYDLIYEMLEDMLSVMTGDVCADIDILP